MRSALGRSPLAGDRRDGLVHSVARKRAPTGPSAAMSSLPTAPSSSIERRADQPMRSALGRSPLAGDRRDGLVLSVARKRAPTGPGAAMSSLPTAPSSSIERRAHQPMRSALCRSPLAGDRRDGPGLSVARKRAPTGPSAAMSSLLTAPSLSIERCAHQPIRSALGRSPLAGDRRDSWCSTVSLIPIPIRSRWAGCTRRRIVFRRLGVLEQHLDHQALVGTLLQHPAQLRLGEAPQKVFVGGTVAAVRDLVPC
jgi:hypothetical protein